MTELRWESFLRKAISFFISEFSAARRFMYSSTSLS